MTDKPKRAVLLTPKALLSFPHLFRPAAMEEGQEPKYSASLLFSPEAQATPEFAALKAAATAAVTEKWPNAVPANLRSPFRKCEEKDVYAKYAGWIFINVSTKDRPGVVKPAQNGVVPITDENDIYAGAFVIASVGPYAYDQKGNKGVSFGLNNVMKVADGERIGGRPSAAQDFGAMAGQFAGTAGNGQAAESLF